MKTFITIFRKEFTDTVRDRRTLFVMVIFPLLLFPLLFLAMTKLQMSQIRKAEGKVLRLSILNEQAAPGLAELTITIPGLRLLAPIPADSAAALIQRDSLDAVIVVAPDFRERVDAMKAGVLTLIFKSSEDYEIAKRRLRDVIDRYEKGLVERRFSALHIDRSVGSAVTLVEKDIATMKERVGKSIGGFLPYLFIIFCFMGSMYPAIDLAAGEKERGTIETLLTAPVDRFQILLGKFTVVVLAGLLSAAISMCGLYVAVRQAAEMPKELLQAVMSILDVQSVLLTLSLLLPLTIFFASVLLSLSMFARSYKEAQSLISPLTIVIILPVAVGMLPGFTLTPFTALIPVLNVSLATKDIIAGTIRPGLLALVYISLILLAGLSLWACARWFDREETIFRGA
jgi:sodium transport system permease protein